MSSALYYYLGRGIKNYLTRDDVKFLWFRDSAFLLKKPTVDRHDSLKHYTLDNCQFIEHIENSIKALSPSWKRRRNAH